MELIKPKLFCLFFLIFLVQSAFSSELELSLRGITAAEARQQLISAAESFLGTPYRFAGLDRRGLDCSGLVYLSFREGLNIEAPRTTQSIYDWAEKIDTEELQPGDLVFFITVGTTVSHMGIYTGGGRFIHSASEGPLTGVIISSFDEAYWMRTYLGAGRVLPPDDEMQLNNYTSNRSTGRTRASQNWEDAGFFVGFGAAWTFGGFFEGAPSPFRGISTLATVGYKWTKYRIGIELRQEWDRALGVLRLPFTFSVGTDRFLIFAGPSYTFGEPSLNLSDGTRYYSGAFGWSYGVSAAFPPIRIGAGALSFYGELAWQSYSWPENEKFSLKPDITANIRLSAGLRYLSKMSI